MNRYRPLFLVVGWLLTTCVILAPNIWTIGLASLWLMRLVAAKDLKLIALYVIMQLLAAVSVFWVQANNQTLIKAESKATYEVAVKATDIKVDGDLLSIRGQVLLDNDQTEELQIYYWLNDQAEQEYWLNQNQAIKIKVEGTLEQADTNGNRGLFNFREYLYRQGIHWVLSAADVQVIEPLSGWQYWAGNQSVAINDWVGQLKNTTIANYMKSLFFNDMASLNPEVLDTYQQIGMIHLFSISGFHAAYLIGVLKRFFLRLGILVEHFNMLAIIILILYSLILGWPYGMFRVVITYLYNWVQQKRGQPVSTLVGTTISMWLIMINNPYSIFTLSFQLTFALSYVVILMGNVIQRISKRALLQELLLSLVCTQITIPFLIAHSHAFSWASLIFNYFYSAFFSIVMFPGLLLILCLHLFGWANHFMWLQDLLALAINILEQLSFMVNEIAALKWIIGITPAFMTAILVGTILYTYTQLEQGRHLCRSYFIFVLSLILIYCQPYLDTNGRVIMLDVGQGDSFLIELPGQRGTYLIDLAGRFQIPKEKWADRDALTIAERDIIPSLTAEGIRRLDGVFLTHGDIDHIGSFAEVMTAYYVDTLYLPIGMQEDKNALADIDAAIATSKNPRLEVQWLKKGDQVILNDQSHLSVLAPDKIGEGGNEDSLVLHGQFGPQKFLFTGDIVGENEVALQKLIADHQIDVDILKVAHHGSDHSTSAEFLQLLQAEQAWLSVGSSNSYGHPGPRLLTDLTDQNMLIYRTDQDGAIHYIFDEKSYTINSVKSSDEMSGDNGNTKNATTN